MVQDMNPYIKFRAHDTMHACIFELLVSLSPKFHIEYSDGCTKLLVIEKLPVVKLERSYCTDLSNRHSN